MYGCACRPNDLSVASTLDRSELACPGAVVGLCGFFHQARRVLASVDQAVRVPCANASAFSSPLPLLSWKNCTVALRLCGAEPF